jgi:hypothetical protein
MKLEKPGDAHSRDAALARLLADALKSQSKLAGGATGSACPDAEILAGYAEQGLAKDEAARWESHFADCNRCQKIIAVLAASGEALTEAEVKKFGTLVATSSAREPGSGTAPVRISRRPKLVRWLAPAIGVAAAVVVWFALRPVLQHEMQDSQRIAATTPAPQGSGEAVPAAPSAKPDETQMAQTNVPPPPAAAYGGLRREATAAQSNSSAATREEETRKKETFQAQSAPLVSELDRAEPASGATDAATEKDKQAAPVPGTELKSQNVDVIGGAAAAAPAPARESGGAAGGAVALSARNQVAALAKVAAPVVVFGSPDRRALWRLGPGGHIEHSSDQGQTWQPQSSGVTTDLVAGAAPSEKVAWIAGRGGIVLRTEDGDHWQQVTPPMRQAAAGAVQDWTGIEARDALHATIISRDLRRFATEDGGRTWVQQ